VEPLCGPEFFADGGGFVGEGDGGLGIPSGAPGQDEGACGQAAGPERHEREQGEQARGGAGDGEVRPLALGFDAGVAADCCEGDLDGPAADEAAQYVEGIGGLVRAGERLRLELAGCVADQQPSLKAIPRGTDREAV